MPEALHEQLFQVCLFSLSESSREAELLFHPGSYLKAGLNCSSLLTGAADPEAAAYPLATCTSCSATSRSRSAWRRRLDIRPAPPPQPPLPSSSSEEDEDGGDDASIVGCDIKTEAPPAVEDAELRDKDELACKGERQE